MDDEKDLQTPAGAGSVPMPGGTATPSVGGGTEGDLRPTVGPGEPIPERTESPDGTAHVDGGGV